ncbi:general substrate transporter [Piromyces finnis]|uniref:General substrate transporter n=1 Tax=Piromyces finnis TaxID=1754191 RepID=A0A1Y1V6Y4_9FUNG|nr:general substrate transporter [Piromyces finnis]|eukprot:ORX48885.1 general substrate transporter [Piromyces finnis]
MNSFQFLVAVTASLGGLLFGYEVGVMNVVLVMDSFRIFFRFHEWKGKAIDEVGESTDDASKAMYRDLEEKGNKAFLEGVITSSFVLGALCGALMATYLGEKFGRQRTIMVGACIFTCGAIIQGSSIRSSVMIAIGRLITGLSIGFTLSSCYQLMTTFGIIVASLINALIWYKTNRKPEGLLSFTRKGDEEISNLEWRLALLLQVVPGLGLATLMCFVPKSPRWLCSKDRDEEAVEILAKLNAASTSDAVVQEELKAIQEDVAATRAAGSSSFVIGSLMMMVFHLSTWACSKLTGGKKDANGKFIEQPIKGWQYAAVASVFLFVFSFAWTWGPVPWVYQAEVFPLRVRVKGSAVGTVSNFLNNWIIGFVGPFLMKKWSTNTFILFAAASFLAWIYSQFYVIECKGLTLEEMDAKMAGKA